VIEPDIHGGAQQWRHFFITGEPMIPDYLRDEIVLRVTSSRLNRAKLKAVCRTLEIDLDAALEPSPSSDEIASQLSRAGQLYSGSIPFHFEVRSGNHVRKVAGRVVYTSEGRNPIGEIGRTTSMCQALTWNPDGPVPAWEAVSEQMLPDGLVHRLSEAVFDAVVEQQSLGTQSVAD
jgi:hypothetical protein